MKNFYKFLRNKFYKFIYRKSIKQNINIYCLQITNNSEQVQKVKLFGFNHFYNKINFGNPNCIEIINLQGNDYHCLISQSAFYPFSFRYIRFRSEKNTNLSLTLIDEDAAGFKYTIPFYENQYIKKNYFNENIKDFDLKKYYSINSKSFLELIIQPKDHIVCSIFFKETN